MDARLSPAMIQTLRIMAAGYEIELWQLCGYHYYPGIRNRRPHAGTIKALMNRKLIELAHIPLSRPYWIVGRWKLTEAGRRAEEEGAVSDLPGGRRWRDEQK